MIEKREKSLHILPVIPFIVLLFCNQYVLEDLLGIYTWKVQLVNYFACSLLSFFTFLLLYHKKYIILLLSLSILVVGYINVLYVIGVDSIIGTAWATRDGDQDELYLSFIDGETVVVRSNEGEVNYSYIMNDESLELSENGVVQEYSIELIADKMKLILSGDTVVFYKK